MFGQSQDVRRRLGVAGRVGAALAAGAALALTGLDTAQAQTEIARGTAVPDGQYPWAVSLHLGSTPTTANLNCSGSHIAPEWVLSAAHCFDNNLNGTIEASELSANEYWFSLNRTKISTTTRGEVIQGQSVILNGANDIALVKLARPSTAPIVALATSIPALNAPVTTAGWGFINNTGTIPDNMQKGAFKVSGSNSLDLNYINVNTEEMCGGDSGGPVFTEAGGVTRLVAVHTNSPGGCGVATGSATGSRVDVALPWIRANIPAQYGFVWGNQPTTASYTPSLAYQRNSTGGTNTITRSSAGVYTVSMPGLGQPNGNVQVTAYGNTSHRCKVVYWVNSGTTLQTRVNCFTATGVPADTYFVAQYFRAGAGNPNQQAYLWAQSGTAASYVASGFYSFNSRGGTNTVVRTGVGAYTANLPGFTLVGGNVAVTAYGGGTANCNVSSWSVSTVAVRCFAPSGAAVDSQWTLRYTDKHVANQGGKGAYLWANSPLSAAYAPSATYAFHSGGLTLGVNRLGVGSYRVNIPSIAASNKTSLMVTAYGSGANCKAASWVGNGAGGTYAYVRCFAANGAAVDSRFTASYITNL
jgi:secreted trypsin-like serine protease